MPTPKRAAIKSDKATLDKAKARNWALTELSQRHPEEFRKILDFYRNQLGIGDSHGRISRPSADGVA